MRTVTLPARLHRAAEVDAPPSPADGDDRRISLSFSSEEPVWRWFGLEVLGHQPGEADLAWANSGRAPLLADHRNAIGAVLGVVESAVIEGGKGRAVVRLGEHADAQDALAKLRAGLLGNISVGYSVEELMWAGERDGVDVYRATRWTPREISLVAAPADTSVGVGRAGPASADHGATVTIIVKEGQMADPTTDTRAAPAAQPTATPAQPGRSDGQSVEAMLAAARTAERERCAEIDRIGAAHNIPVAVRDKAKQDGMDLPTFRGIVLDHYGEDAPRRMNAASAIGLTQREANRFSFVRALHAMANPEDRGAQSAAAFEREVSDAAKAADPKRSFKGMAVPADVLEPGHVYGQRNQVAGTPSAGGALVATELQAGSFIELLRARSVLARLGSTRLEGLSGNVAIPRQSGGGTAYWVGENVAPTATAFTVDQVPLTPHTVAGWTNYSRRLLLQSSLSVEALIRTDLARVLALAIDKTALEGDAGADAPDGIADTAGINGVDFATAGKPLWAEVVDCWAQIAIDNADEGSLGYVLNPAMAGYLMSTPRVSGDSAMMMLERNSLAGWRAEISTQAAAAKLWFGNWADLVQGFWSGLDLMADPYSLSTSGAVRVTAFQDTDNGVRHAASFCMGVHVP
jgi:HK97 family phage major capsid protein/HK97 family phage prohead protease